MSLMILNRLYEKEMLGKDYDWKEIINAICKHNDKNIELSIQILTKLLKDHRTCIKDVTKSGYIKYIFSVHLQTVIKDKNNLYKVLKMLKIVSQSDNTILINR